MNWNRIIFLSGTQFLTKAFSKCVSYENLQKSVSEQEETILSFYNKMAFSAGIRNESLEQIKVT